jgi:hypothetical protein
LNPNSKLETPNSGGSYGIRSVRLICCAHRELDGFAGWQSAGCRKEAVDCTQGDDHG